MAAELSSRRKLEIVRKFGLNSVIKMHKRDKHRDRRPIAPATSAVRIPCY